MKPTHPKPPPKVLTVPNGTVWTLRAIARSGEGRYAPRDVRQCPRLVLASGAELAKLGAAPARPENWPQTTPPQRAVPKLTPRMRDVLFGAARGETSKETADRLGLAERTVKAHKRLAYRRLRARSVGHAVALAIAYDEIRPGDVLDGSERP